MPHAIQHLEHFLRWFFNSKEIIGAGIGAIIAAAIGAYIGGRMATSAAIKAQQQAAKDQRDRDAEADRRSVHGTLRAIAAELRVLKSQPLDHLTKMLEEREQVRKCFLKDPAPLAVTHTELLPVLLLVRVP